MDFQHYATPVNALFIVMGLGFVWMVVRFNRDNDNQYNVVDILMGPGNRASLTNHILVAMCGMSVWVVVDRSNDGKDVDNLVLGILAIFVLGKTATAITDILNKPTESSTTTTTTAESKTETEVIVPAKKEDKRRTR